MALRKSVGLLPEVFRTSANNKFLNASVDQLISEKDDVRINNFIGRRFSPNFQIKDSYVREINKLRQNYQLEPAVTYTNLSGNVETVSTFVDFLNSVKYNNGQTDNIDKLFNQEFYNWSSFVDLDKLINYGEYFWLPNGPDSVNVFGSQVDTSEDYVVYREGTTYRQVGFEEVGFDSDEYGWDQETVEIVTGNPVYRFNQSTAQSNETIYLARGGNYTFTLNQPGIPFWIQTEVGLTGISAAQQNLSTREVLGVSNNGEDVGTITFNVPQADDQTFYTEMSLAANVDLCSTLSYNQVHNQVLSAFLDNNPGIDNFTELDGKTLVFLNDSENENLWDAGSPFDGYGYDADNTSFDTTTRIPLSERYDVYTITITDIGGTPTITLLRTLAIPQGQKVRIKQGKIYGNRELWKNTDQKLELIPPISSLTNELYYQDGLDANRFGRIILVDIGASVQINVDNDIIGKQQYISPNGVTFTNGLKIEFDTSCTPAAYQNNTYYVEGVGQPGGISLIATTSLLTPESYTNNLGEGYDTKLFDAQPYDGATNSPTDQDYIVSNRSSIDNNAWARGNRWFHRQVIEATAGYNNFITDIDDAARAKRPIIEFIPNLHLYNMGITSKAPVSIIDTEQDDALSNVNGTTGYFADGIALTPDMTVIFASDTDPHVRNKVYRVDFIDEDSNVNTAKIINLVQIDTVPENTNVLSSLGASNQGVVYYYKNSAWGLAQQKTKLNQEPLFDVFDGAHNSFSTVTSYPSTNFAGTKLFSYKRNLNGVNDSILNFGLSYKNFNNVGDIVFDNNFISDSFAYTKTGTGQVNVIVKSGHVHQYDRTGTVKTLLNGWTKIASESRQFQIVEYTVTDELYSFEIGSEPEDRSDESLLVYVNGTFQYKQKYSVVETNNRWYITFNSALAPNDNITIKVYSTYKNLLGYYEVPKNLENNANNGDFENLTLGQIRNHLVESTRTIKEFTGVALGSNNTRDLPVKQYPGKILQHSAGSILPLYLFTNTDASIVNALRFSMEEYSRFKNKFIDNMNKLDLDLRNIRGCVDQILEFMVGSKNEEFAFYYSDMLPWGSQKTTVYYTIDDATERTFEFNNQFDLTSISTRGLLVYRVRGQNVLLLTEGVDYSFDTDEPKVTFTNDVVLQVGDVIEMVEYTNTDGSFVPPTPTKLGLWPKYTPRVYADNTYSTTLNIIQGHDGSKWAAYNDLRDDIILELEKRIYNNIKTQYRKDLFDFSDLLPGYFRSTLADRNEQLSIIRGLFGSWAQKNRLDSYKNSTFTEENKFSWNYKNSVEKLTNTKLPGSWRAIYRWLYDTDTPHLTPWEMLGQTQKPTWWDDRYGEAPYTAGNTVLWEDLEAGKLYNGIINEDFSIQKNYKRPGLTSVVPVDQQGVLRAPSDFLTIDAVSSNTNDPWAFGDESPVETAWVRSSEYPFAMQLIAMLQQPAKYFGLLYDTNLIQLNTEFNQLLKTGKSYRPVISDFHMHGVTDNGNINRVEGANQFLYNYLKYMDLNPTDYNTRIRNLGLNLAYKLAGFSDKNFLKVVAESATPNSSNQTVFIPDDDYSLITLKSTPVDKVTYSGIQVIKRSDGYQITGYDIDNPYFRIIPSVNSTNRIIKTVGNTNIFVFNDFENYTADIPYGVTLTSVQQVCDLFVSYQRYLESKGLVFNSTVNGEVKDFTLTAQEFVFWTQQIWPNDSVFSASPCYDILEVEREFTTTDDFSRRITLRDANNQPIKKVDYNVRRIDNNTTITINPDKTYLYSAVLDPIQYEHVIVFNNSTIFNDIIYQPELGNRQERMKIVGTKAGSWNGTIHAPGYFINDSEYDLWQQDKDYKRADYVSFNNKIYVAAKDHGGTLVFDYNNWILSPNQRTGLVPNISNKAQRFTDFFDIDNVNLETSTDHAAKGTIGFRSRDYLENIGLDDVSQVKFYQGMIKGKGTPEVINKLTKADLTNLDQEVDFFEEWAFRVGEYGSIDSNQVVEVILPEAQSQNNPVVIEFLDSGDTVSNPDYLGFKQVDLYKVPNNYTKNLFSLRSGSNKDDISNAGYPRIDDIDLTLFDINNISSLNSNLSQIGRGSKIWVAKSDNNSWDILRVTEVTTNITGIQSSTNGLLTFTTDSNHGLVKNDKVVVRLDPPFGGFFKLASTTNNTLTVEQDIEIDEAIDNLSVTLWKLESVRFEQITDLSNFTPPYGWNKNEIAWVDTNNLGKWSALKKAEPWSTATIQTTTSTEGDGHLGTSIVIGKNSLSALVGIPDAGSVGNVVPYVLNPSRVLEETVTLTVNDIGASVARFGASVAGGNNWYAVGAPDTNSNRGAVFVYERDGAGNFNLRQPIYLNGASVSDNFGFSMCMSQNDRYMFVGAPGANSVYVYARKDRLTKDNELVTLTADGSSVTYALGFTPVTGISLYVEDGNGKVYLPYKDFTLSGSDITFTIAPAVGLNVVIREETHFELIDTIIGSDTMAGDQFGYSIDCSTDGGTVVVGAPYADVANADSTLISDAGEVYVFSNILQNFAGDGSTVDFTTDETISSVEYIEVNGVEQTLADGAFGGFDSDSSENRYTRSSNTISFRYEPQSTDTIKVFTGNFAEVQKLDQNMNSEEPTDGELFGTSVSVDPTGAMIAVGVPGEDELNPNTGSVYVFTDAGLRYGSVTSNSDTGISYTSGDTFYINDWLVTVSSTGSTVANLITDINNASISLITPAVGTDSDTIVVTSTSINKNKKLKIRPGTGTSFKDGIKFNPYVMTQQLNHPLLKENENYGQHVAFDKYVSVDGTVKQNLAVSSDRASSLAKTRFDIDTVTTSETYGEYLTTFDNNSTKFVDVITQSGAVYIYETLDAVSPETVSNTQKLIYVQQLVSNDISYLDQFGAALAFNDDKLLVGAPLDDAYAQNAGGWYQFNNFSRASAWQPYRSENSKVDVDRVNRVSIYDNVSRSVVSVIDYIDPYKQKIAGPAQAEIDYVLGYDPAVYTVSNTGTQMPGAAWNDERVGKVWWDLSACAVLDYEQGDLDYRTTYWGRFFPGSSIDIYEWVESAVLPSEYTGSGEVKHPDDSNFATTVQFDPAAGTTVTKYYFWVKNSTEVPEVAFRNISTSSVAQLIEDPKSAGLKFIQVLAQNALSITNIKNDLKSDDLVLAVNYDVVNNDGILHSEWDLVQENNPAQQLPARIYNKLVDSLAGQDSLGGVVPDPTLSDAEKYGIGLRPRQTMFVNRQQALKVLVDYTNKIFKSYPVIRQSTLTSLFSSELQPTIVSGEWNTKVASIVERDYLNTITLSTGYKVLVDNDETLDDLWTIYTLQADKTWFLTKVQSYDTTKFWEYATWYADGYNELTIPNYQVSNEAGLLTLNATVGELAKVTTNDDGNFSFFVYQSNGTWREVIIERGTIQLKSSIYDYTSSYYGSFIGFDNDVFDFNYFDKIPVQEVRNILKALKNEIFIDDRAIYFNQLFFRLIEYSLHESVNQVDWVFKTSFLTVLHKLRSLAQYPTFKNDNDHLIEDYINEVKPYHTKIREYVSKFDGNDNFDGDVTDFDVHAFYDENLMLFRKPSGDYSGDEILRTQGLNNPWSKNYSYFLSSVEIYAAGSGYIQDPIVTVSAPDLAGGVRATVVAVSNTNNIIRVRITNPGSGYITTPTITVTGAGTGCILLARMANNTNREFDISMKFDRITYSSTVMNWAANTSYSQNDLISYYNSVTGSQEVYKCIVSGGFTSGSTFSVENSSGTTVLEVYADENLASNADRIAAFYTPTAGMLGDDLDLLQRGTDYKGVRVSGAGFEREPGWDTAAFDNVGFDDFDIDTDGLTVLSGASALDSIIKSTFQDLALGTRPEDIDVNGGQFVDEYNSHAPEEVIPGIVFDTLDMEVFTDPSDDFEWDGNGVETVFRSYEGDGTTNTFIFSNTTKAQDVENVFVYLNATPVRSFTKNYLNRTVTLATAPTVGQTVYIYSFGNTGEKPVHEESFFTDGETFTFTLGINYDLAQQYLVLINGETLSTAEYTVQDNGLSILILNDVPAENDHVHVFAFNKDPSRQAYTEIDTQEITLTSGTNTYELNKTVRYAQPFEGNVIVELNNLRLRPTNAKHYVGDGSTVTYSIPGTAEESALVNDGDIRVTVISKDDSSTLNPPTNKVASIDYVVDPTDGSSLRTITFYTAPSSGDTVIVSVRTGAEYLVDGNTITLTSSVSFSTGDKLYVTTFANHDPLRIQTKVFVGLGSEILETVIGFDDDSFDSGDFDGISLAGSSPSKYALDRTVTNSNNLWITLNGVKLHPGQFIIENGNVIDLSGQTIDSTSIIVISHFTENVVQPTIGFRIFKNMLGDYEYLRIAADNTTELTQNLYPTDTKIYVDDVSKLPQASVDSDNPGVIFVGNERVTYWEINTEDNYITNIRRSTAGTRFATIHRVGTRVIDASSDQNLPETNTHTHIWYDAGVGSAANGAGLQASNSVNARFLRAREAFVPNFIAESNSPYYLEDGYVEDGYVEVRP